MKKLLITLLLVSPFSLADWGDVYYCQLTSNLMTNMEGKRKDSKPEKFQFKLDEAKKAMVFGKEGYFKGMEMKLTEGMNRPSKEDWYAANRYSMGFFMQGGLVISMVGTQGVKSMSADCDKF